jgi:hypothetical protein
MRIENLIAPELGKATALTRRFRVYEDTLRVDRKPGQVDFIYRIRPTEPGTYEVPSLEVAYFDASDREYRIVKTRPIPIRVNPATDVQAPILMGDEHDGNADSASGAGTLVVAPLCVLPTGQFVSRPISPWGNWLWAVPGPLAWLLAVLGVQARRALRVRRSGSRRRHALHRALVRLRTAKAAAARHDPAANRLICTAVQEYISDKYGIAGSALTPSEVREHLNRKHVDQDAVARLHEILGRHFNAGYGEGAAGNIESDCDAMASIFRKLDSRDRVT